MHPKHITQAIIPPFKYVYSTCVSPVVTQIKYHRIKTNNTCCGYRIKHIIQSLIHYCIYCLSTFYAVVFFICIYVVALNNRIYVSVTYALCLYGCSWVILLTTCGCKTIVSTIEHTFVFTMKISTGFYQ